MSIAERHHALVVEAATPAQEPPDLDHLKAKHLLASEPKPQRFVIEGLIPEPIAAAIVAPGGTGKSFLLMQMAASITTGVPFMGMEIREPGAVLMLGAEDDLDEMQRRLHSIVKEYAWQGCPLDLAKLGERFYPVSLVGKDNLLTINDGKDRNEARIQQIIAMARAIPDLRLIIIDPAARFRSGPENDNEGGTRFVEVLEEIRTAAGVTVLCAHHARKGGTGDHADEIRGGSGFVDAIRFAALLSTMRPEDAKKAGLSADDADKAVRFRRVKGNYRCDVSEFWLERGVGGVLRPREAPILDRKERQTAKGEERYTEILPKLVALVKERAEAGKPLSLRKLREDYGGTANTFGIGKDMLDSIAKRAIREGKLDRHKDGGLHTW